MKYAMGLVLGLSMATSALAAPAPQGSAATPAKSTKKAHSAAASEVSRRLDEMQQAISAQQQQIQQLGQEVKTRDAVIEQLQQRLDQSQTAATEATTKADTAASEAAKQGQAVTALQGDVSDLKQNNTNTALTLQETQKNISEMGSPLALHYKGISITPVGFFAAETVWRQKALGADVNTPFNAIPFAGASQSNISEFFGSGRQSRVGMLAQGKLASTKVTGYVEADFLSAGVTSNNNQSNSYTLRQRQFWGQAVLKNGFSFTGGQMWSLVTETKNGVDNRTEALPMSIDAQYVVGFSWARQYGFRVAKNFGDKAWLAFSVENPQTTFAAHGASNNFLFGSAGAGGGLYNATANYSFNYTPDFVFKAVYQPKWGHAEVFGIISDFRDRVFPNATATPASAAGAFNSSVMGWGMGANVRASLLNKHVDVGAHFLTGDAVGRYGTSSLPDVTIHPDGTLNPIRSYQGLGTLEFHHPKFDIYTNVGAEFARRTVTYTSGTVAVGYGSPFLNNSGCQTETLPGAGGFAPGALAACTGDTRNIIEGTVGFWYRFYKGPKGTVQWGPQYEYLVRNTWNGAAGLGTLGQPAGTENVFMTSFRYYLP